jgi:hypothetical protein
MFGTWTCNLWHGTANFCRINEIVPGTRAHKLSLVAEILWIGSVGPPVCRAKIRQYQTQKACRVNSLYKADGHLIIVC